MKISLRFIGSSLAVWLGLQSSFAASLLPFTEHFNYAAGNLGSVGSGGSPAWAGSSTANVVVSGNVDGAAFGLPASTGSKNVWTTSTSSSTYALFATASGDIPNTAGTTVYFSCLLKVTDATSVSTAGENVLAVLLQNSGSTKFAELWLKNVSGAVQVGIAKSGSPPVYATSGAGANIANTTNLLVISYAYVAGASNDLVNLWVNPATGGSESAASISTTGSIADNTSATGMGRLYFFGGVAADVDSVRMGLNWSDVTPSSGGASAPNITTQPTAQSVGVNQSANFSVTASGTAPLGYQWFFNTNTALASTSNTLALANVQRTNAGNYYVVVSNASGSVTSSYVTLTVTNAAPVANTDSFSRLRYLPLTMLKADLLANDTDPDGDTLTLASVNLTTTNGIALITNATQIFYTNLANVTDRFSYTVSDGFGGAATGTASISVTSAVARVASSQLRSASNTLTFAAQPGYNYQFQRSLNLSNWSLVSLTAATGTTFAVTDTFADLGYSPTGAFYRVAIEIPAAPSITTQPSSLVVTQGNNASFTVAASGSSPLNYQWRKNNSAVASATNTTFTIVGAQSSDASNYTVVVANQYGSVTSSVATLTVLIPPSITAPPSSLVVTQGNNATFTASASGTAPLGYQWAQDGVDISDATNTSLTVTNAQSGDEGDYTVTVSNVAGSVTSAAAALTVLVPPSIIDQPIAQTVPVGDNAIFSVNADGTSPLAYQWRLNGVALAGETSAVLTLTTVATNDAGNYSVVVTNVAGSITSSVAVLTVNVPVVAPTSGVILDELWADATRTDTTLPNEAAWYASSAGSLTVATNALTGTTGGSSSRSWWTYFTTNAVTPVSLAVGQTLKVTLNFSCTGVSANSGNAGLRIGLYDFSGGTRTTSDGSSPGGAGESGYMVGMNFGQTFGVANPLTLYVRTNIASTALQSSASDYSALATGGGSSGSPGFSNGVAYVMEFSVTRNASSVVITNKFTGANLNVQLTATDTNTAAASYTSDFDGFSIRPATTTDTATNFIFSEFKVELLGSGGSTNPVAPSVTTQPTNLTVAVGQSASFSLVASGSVPLAYQWFFNATNALVNGTNATYTTNSVTTNLAGSYTVRVTNSAGAVTSSVAVLTVTSPTAPSITTQPTNFTAAAGGSATFTVVAGGTAPLSYQWFFNTNTVLAGATNSSLTLANVQSTNAGGYSARVTNSVGAVTSSVVTLTVTAVAPSITTPPSSQSVIAGGNATFTVTAAGTAPLSYQWFFNTNTLLVNATNATYTTNGVTTNNAGGYSVRVTNSVGSVTSAVATLTISASQSNSLYNLYGFAQSVTGGGIVADTSATYAKVTNALSLATAVKSTTIKVIEIMNDLDLGWNEVGAAAQAVGSLRVAGALPIQHPALITSGVSVLDISRAGLTIFSANGARIRHCNFNIKSANNIVIRNLKFDEMWEWDEATKGNYDRNDWDFITIGNGGSTVSNVWIDHCTFTKAYDGDTDMKGGCYNITHSWNRYRGDDEDVNTNSFVWQQVNALEAGRATNTFYNFLRNNGFAITNIVTILHGHDKTHLIGATAFNTENASHKITFHHQWYQNPWDRLPRLRAGNVHNYNLFVEDSAGLDAKRLRDNIANAMSSANRNTLNNTYHFQVFLNGSISTEGGAVLVENSIYQDCLTPLRNNQTDVSNPSYTGKIMALNSIYSFRNTDGTTNNYTGASTNAPGDTYFGPVQAPVIAFSWNLTNNVLPYTYVMTDPTQLKSVLTNSATGCGSGVLQWNKTNWLKTSY